MCRFRQPTHSHSILSDGKRIPDARRKLRQNARSSANKWTQLRVTFVNTSVTITVPVLCDCFCYLHFFFKFLDVKNCFPLDAIDFQHLDF